MRQIATRKSGLKTLGVTDLASTRPHGVLCFVPAFSADPRADSPHQCDGPNGLVFSTQKLTASTNMAPVTRSVPSYHQYSKYQCSMHWLSTEFFWVPCPVLITVWCQILWACLLYFSPSLLVQNISLHWERDWELVHIRFCNSLLSNWFPNRATAQVGQGLRFSCANKKPMLENSQRTTQ